MTGNTRVPRTEITGIYGGMLKIAMRKMLGGVPEGARGDVVAQQGAGRDQGARRAAVAGVEAATSVES